MKFSAILFCALALVKMSQAADIVVDVDMDEVDESELSGALMDRFVKFINV